MKTKNRAFLYASCVLTVVGLLMVCSKSSPLYPLNDWPDINIFYTIGKGMVHGKVPYVDLLDHKGPYIYAVAAAAYLIDGSGFTGYFLFELLSFYFFLYYSYKLLTLYCEKVYLWILPILGITVAVAKSFVHGGSLEQLSLGIFAYAIYELLSFLRDQNRSSLSAGALAVNGLLAGVLLWSKFTLLGLYIAWMLTITLVYLYRRQLKELGRAILLFVGGMTAAGIPWLIYFGMHGAVRDWIRVYLYQNIFGYTSGEAVTLWSRCRMVLENTWSSLTDRGNWCYSLPVFLGILFFLFAPHDKVSLKEKFTVCLMGLGMAAGIFIGGTKHDYYGLPLAVFAVWGMRLCCSCVRRLQNNVKKRRKRPSAEKKWVEIVLCGMVLICTMAVAYRVSPNTYLLLMDEAQMPQYRFAERILASEDKSLLNYLFLDGGFYTVTGEVPQERTFCLINMNREQRIREQNEYAEQGRTHWVVTWRAQETTEEELCQIPVLSDHYDLVDYVYFYFEGDIRTYALYEKR